MHNHDNNNSGLQRFSETGGDLFERVTSILEEARKNVVRAVNSNMVIAYWLIGREIVREVQNGDARAEYGKQIIGKLSQQLTKKYKHGFSVTNLQYFRKFYQVYSERLPKQHPMGAKSLQLNFQSGKPRPAGDESVKGFSPQLSWSHYRALMRVNDDKARWFYEHEAITCSWNKRELERNINSYYYERLLKSNYPQQMLESARNENVTVDPASESLKDPYVLEFLELPDIYNIHESQLESAIITNLQQFLLELGKGFAFVARQKRLQYDDDFFYIDLVFYNYILKFFLLIDLKIDELTHKDVRQMDSYVRMFDDISTSKDDNPTIGLILCTKKNKTVAKYSVLSERKQIFASKYMLYLPTEQELVNELEHKRLLIEDRLSMENHEDD